MYLEILSKIIAESLLSLYPIFVKYINLSIGLQMWSRFFTYVLISSFFIDYNFIIRSIFSKYGLALALTTLAHVYCSYRGFQILESGIAYTIFYTYPLMILLLSGSSINFIILFALLGVYILSKKDVENYSTDPVFTKKEIIKENFKYEGLVMILLAAFTEALIYFIVRSIKTKNNWNHLFISYALCAVLLSIYFYKDIKSIQLTKTLSTSLLFNLCIGLFGYLLRFFAISRLEPSLYAPLSYFGILMAYLYGIIINKDVLTIKKIIGTILILIPNFWIILNKST